VKQIVVISGKGGTGKTVITASLAALAGDKVIADCDVDAPDLHLLLHPHVMERYEFKGQKKAVVDPEKCSGCGRCVEVCRFDAISQMDGAKALTDPISCEGCAVCYFVCPDEAIRMEEHCAGECLISETKYGPMVHARLGVAEENSGKLVSMVKQNAKAVAEANALDLILIDGPPGIGCPVIASLSGVDLALAVTEPTLSGEHDLRRAVSVADHFGVRAACIINKYDINEETATRIQQWCLTRSIPVLARIPYDRRVLEALAVGIPFVEYADFPAATEIRNIWKAVAHSLEKS